MEEGVGLVAIILAEHHRPLAFELALLEQRIADRVLHELQARLEAVHTHRDVVIDALGRGRAVPHGAELVHPLQVLLLAGDRPVGLEEHVLVEVRETVVLRALRVGAVLDVQLDRDQRDRMVLDHDDFQAVVERRRADRQLVLRRQRGGDEKRSQSPHS